MGNSLIWDKRWRVGAENEGHLVRVFVDIGANCNTISRKFYEVLVAQDVKCVFTLAQLRDSTLIWSVNRFYTLLVTELLSRPQLEQLRKIFFLAKIFVLDDVEDMVMGVQGIIRSLLVSQLTT